MTGRVIAITGGKGGVGKSTTTINLGVSLRLDGYSTVVVDADVEMPNLMEMLGLEATSTIHDVLSGAADTSEALVQIGEGFAAIPGDPALSGYGSIEPERLNEVVEALATQYDYVLLDTGAGLSYDDLFPIGLADEIVLVMSPDPAAVENAKRTYSFIQMLNRTIRGIVLTKVEGEVDETIPAAFDTELLGAIPFDEVVSRSTAAGKPIELIAPDSPPAKAYRELESNLTDGRLPPSRLDLMPASDDAAADADESASGEAEPVEDAGEPPRAAEGETSDPSPKKPGLLRRIASRVT